MESTLGRGSTFTCFLPIASTTDSTGVRPPFPAPTGSVRPPAPTPTKDGLPPGCLLVIEDDAIFARVLVDVVNAQGTDCVVAGDGSSGLDLARKRRPRGIILDVRLPDIDGWRVMEELRQDPITADIPVHFVSALDAPERGLALGALGFLTKPASRVQLQAVVATLISVPHAHSPRVLVVEDDLPTGDSLLRLLTEQHLDVRRVTRAHEALLRLEQEPFGCLILDLALPDMDGLELLRELRARYGNGMPAVVVYTARSLSTSEIRAIEEYTQAIITKEGDASSERLVDEVRFFVRRVKEAVTPPRNGGLAAPPSATSLRLDGRNVLVVDDDMRTVYALSALLRGRGAEVLVADTGAAALEVLAKRTDVDAILMDIMMPELDGYETMRRIRREARFRDTFMVALTAKAMAGESKRCIDAGANEHLPKPNRFRAVGITPVRPYRIERSPAGWVLMKSVVEPISAAGTPLERPAILLVDDTEANLVALEGILSVLAADLVRAQSGNEALRLLLKREFAMVLLDVQMPEMDGFEVARYVRDNPQTSSVPIIFITAMHETPENVLRGYDSGAIDLLFKPVNPFVLRSKVKTFLELHASKRRLEDEIEAHKATLAELEAFNYSVSHDLRAPLRPLETLTQFLMDNYRDRLDDRGVDYLTRIGGAARRMNALISDLLKLSHVGRSGIQSHTVDLSALVGDIVGELKRSQPERNVELTCEAQILERGDPALLRIALENLLRNAWKFTGKLHAARIAFGRAGPEERTYFVADNGVGFDPSCAESLFQPFQRLHPASEFEGTGIGLAIVARVIARHGGRIWSESSPERGARFVFTLGHSEGAPAVPAIKGFGLTPLE